MDEIEYKDQQEHPNKKNNHSEIVKEICADLCCLDKDAFKDTKPDVVTRSIFLFFKSVFACIIHNMMHAIYVIPLTIIITYPLVNTSYPMVTSISVAIAVYIVYSLFYSVYAYTGGIYLKNKIFRTASTMTKDESMAANDRAEIYRFVEESDKCFKLRDKSNHLRNDLGYSLENAEIEIFKDYMQSERDKFINTPGNTAEIQEHLRRFSVVHQYLYGRTATDKALVDVVNKKHGSQK